MLKVYNDCGLMSMYEDFGTQEQQVLDRVNDEDLIDMLETELEVLYPEGISFTALSDLLYYDEDFIYHLVGMTA